MTQKLRQSDPYVQQMYPSIKFRCLPRLMRLFSFSTHPNVYAIGYRRSRQCSPLTVFNFASAKPNTCIQLWVFKQDTPTPGNPCIFTESLQNLYRTERSLAPLMLKFISVLRETNPVLETE